MAQPYRKRRITWINCAKRQPNKSDEYNVVWVLEDGEYPLSTTMEYESIKKEWTDPKGNPDKVINHLILYWSHIPKPPSRIKESLWKSNDFKTWENE